MPSWTELLDEINAPLQKIRLEYLAKLHEHTGRNVVAYYSGWLQKDPHLSSLSICDADMAYFMSAFYKLDKSKGLDLILHTPGGDIAATEALVSYFHRMFENNIRCFIPQLAMSAGTMIACGCSEIIMGKQSSIGPFDPQVNGVPAYAVLEEFSNAKNEIKKQPHTIPIWQVLISKYHPTFVVECQNAINLSSEIVKKWLVKVMFAGDADADTKADTIVQKLNNHVDTKAHARHIDIDTARSFGLKVQKLEDDNELQDIILTLHHAYLELFNEKKVCKIVENHRGIGMLVNHP